MSTLTLPAPQSASPGAHPEKKDLISVEMNTIHVHLYDATPADLRCLSEAIEAVLRHVATFESLHYPTPEAA